MNGHVQISVYQSLVSLLQDVCRTRAQDAAAKELNDYILSTTTDNAIDALVESQAHQHTLTEISTNLRLANDPQFRAALRADKERIATLIVSIFDSSSSSDEEHALHLKRDRGQLFIDVVQDTLDEGLFSKWGHNQKARRLIRKVVEACDIFPSSLLIDLTQREEHVSFAGGYADVYRACECKSRKLVAVKFMRRFLPGSDLRNSRLRFFREALGWKDLHHPYVLPFLGMDRASFPSDIGLVSPWMENGTVLAYLPDYGQAANVDKLLYEIIQGLEYLHSRNIVHGDLRGSNILVNEHFSACLADFGLSTFSDLNTASTTSTTRRGSLYWMAPELLDPDQFGGGFVRTSATDIYAFGCVCFELYTGKPPFSEFSEPAALIQVINGERAARPCLPRPMSDDLWQLVKSMWAHSLARRPPTRVVAEKLLWPAPPRNIRPLPPLPDTPPNRSPSGSPLLSILEDPGVLDDVISPEEDFRRLSIECKLGAGNARILMAALSVPSPEQLDDAVIVGTTQEFYQKCITSQEVLSTQIEWAFAAAERSRAEDTSSESTSHELLLADLLASNQQLTETLRSYDELERMAFKNAGIH
ncbi:kinase-like protein [Favolaschia claudopus]|uniref:Kinase-like protein n=1 Tax=Favolaschia claudopus TaxID=2862362 RepID=A0AAW0DSF0_9AGAR